MTVRGAEPTRFVDHEILDRLSLWEDVQQLFNNVGWGFLLSMQVPTYERAVLEVLGTCQPMFKTATSVEAENISFQFFNAEYNLTVEQINAIFHCPAGGLIRKPPQFHKHELWQLITLDNGRFESGKSRASMIRNPVFRIIQRILAHTVLARKDNNNMRLDEMFILWAMLQRYRLDLTRFLVLQMYHITQLERGIICIGGLFTPILQHIASDNLARLQPMAGDTILSARRLFDMRILSNASPHFTFRQNADDHFPLPQIQLTALSDYSERMNWRMDTIAHQTASGARGPEGVDPDLDAEPEDEPESPTGEATQTDHEGTFRGRRRAKDTGAEDEIEQLQDQVRELEGQFAVARGDISMIRHTQMEMRADQRAFLDEQRAFQADIYARAKATARQNAEMLEMMRRFEAYQMSQGHHWPPPPPQ